MTASLPLLALSFPEIDPVLIQIGPIAIRWYALAYIAGLFLGWRYCVRLGERYSPSKIEPAFFDDLLRRARAADLGACEGYSQRRHWASRVANFDMAECPAAQPARTLVATDAEANRAVGDL